jgi:hypothetical protein
MSKLILLQKPKCQVKAVLFGDALVIVPPSPFMLLFAELAIRNTWMVEVMYQRRKDTEEVMRLGHNNITVWIGVPSKLRHWIKNPIRILGPLSALTTLLFTIKLRRLYSGQELTHTHCYLVIRDVSKILRMTGNFCYIRGLPVDEYG